MIWRIDIIAGTICLATGLLGFLAYGTDWGPIVALYELRILFIPVGVALFTYRWVSPLVTFLIAVILGVALYVWT